jgi:NAD(P)-dependent dehydrogenase (short-subunit alcohol dehydrogenase family)
MSKVVLVTGAGRSLGTEVVATGRLPDTSTAGLVGSEFTADYAASKFAEEGWMESLRHDVEPYDIHTTVMEPDDPAKLARALLTIVDQDKPLRRFVAGADAIEAGRGTPRPSQGLPRAGLQPGLRPRP